MERRIPATAGVECSGHGKCLTMENYKKELSHNAYKYGLDTASLSHQSFSIDDETRVFFHLCNNLHFAVQTSSRGIERISIAQLVSMQ